MPLTRLRNLLAARVDARPVALVRIVIGAALLVRLVDGVRILFALTLRTTLLTPYVAWAPAPTRSLVVMLLVAWGIAGLCFMIGYRTRLAAVVLVVSLSTVLMLDEQSYSNHVYLLAIVVALLGLADAGARYSVDSLGREPRVEREPATVQAWPIFLLNVQVTIVYLFAALNKLTPEFASGILLAHFLPWKQGVALVGLLPMIGIAMVLSVSTILIELVLAVWLWIPSRRGEAFVLGFFLHIGMVAFISAQVRLQLGIFAVEMWALYLLFLKAKPGSRVVVWDDSCTFCARWVALWGRLDWLGALDFVGSSDSAAREAIGVTQVDADGAIQLIGPQGRSNGFVAVGRILEVLPVSFLWAALFRLPMVRHIGVRGYRAIAARRSCKAALAS